MRQLLRGGIVHFLVVGACDGGLFATLRTQAHGKVDVIEHRAAVLQVIQKLYFACRRVAAERL